MPSGAPLHGFRDFYPEQFAERAWLMARWREVVRRYGFAEYDGPPLEPLDLYTRKSGEEIVGQLFDFIDKGGREVCLRPEMTPTFARMVAARANALRKPVRWFAVPQLFRYEKAQKGRLREHFQLNVDIVGEADVTADAELVACAVDIVRAVGLTSRDVRVRVSDRRLLAGWLRAVGVPDAAHGAAFAVIDKLERQPREVSLGKLAEAGIAGAPAEAVCAAASTTFDEVRVRLRGTPSEGHAEDFARFQSYLEALVGEPGWLRFDLSIVRGLAYYTGIVFELFDAAGAFRAIAGGGRYDRLLEGLGGVDLPALGFGMGDVVLGELLREKGLLGREGQGLDYWVAAQGGDPALLAEVMRVAGALRRRGHRVEYALHAQSAKKQLKAAVAAGAQRLVLLPAPGATDPPLPAGSAVVRDLASGTDTHVTLADWLATV
jgi:histidyl-tRNA synthetase